MKRIAIAALAALIYSAASAQPGLFNLRSPSDSAWADATPLFRWDSSTGASYYQLWFDGSPYTTGILTNEYQVLYSIGEPRHTWFVRAIATGGQATPSNQTWTLNIDATPPGLPNQAVYFDGTDDYIFIPNSSSLNPASRLTLEAWVIFEGGGTLNPRILAKQTSSQGYGLFLNGTGSSRTLTFHVNVSGGNNLLQTTATLLADNWYHVAGVYDGALMRIYINGALSISQAMNTGTVVATTAELNLGRKPVSSFDKLRGYLDEVRIWNIARTQSEIQNSRNTALEGNEQGLIGYWRFDEVAGATVTDHSGNGNHGLLTSGAARVLSNSPDLGYLCRLITPNPVSIVGAPVTFSWTQAVDTHFGPPTYQLFVDEALRSTQYRDTVFVAGSPFPTGQHSWYIRATDSLGNTRRSYSRTFQSDASPPNPFNLVSPPDSAVLATTQPVLTWQATNDSAGGSGLRKYQLWIDGSVNIDSLSTSSASATPAAPLGNGLHTWYILAIDAVGNSRISNSSPWSFNINITSVGEWVDRIPTDFVLLQNYPNPFNPSTTIKYGLPMSAFVTLELFDDVGQRVATLVDAQQSPGYHQVVLNAAALSSGIYLIRFRGNGITVSKKLLLIR